MPGSIDPAEVSFGKIGQNCKTGKRHQAIGNRKNQAEGVKRKDTAEKVKEFQGLRDKEMTGSKIS